MSVKYYLKSIYLWLCYHIFHNHKSKVIFYHDIHDETVYTDMGTHITIFKEHINTILNQGFEIVPKITKKYRQISICLDDGFRGVWDNRDFFNDNNIKPTIFIAVDLIGKDGYLNIEEIKELYRLGFNFQGHSWTHTNLTKYSQEELYKELFLSKQAIETLTNNVISEICFPQGFYSDLVVEEARKAGYTKLYTSDPKPFCHRVEEDLIPRYLVQDASARLLKYIIMGGMDSLYSYYNNYHKK